MHGDRLVHSPACRRHPVAADCPVDCLAPLLRPRVWGRLARADGRGGAPVASCGVPVTVGDVVRLHRQGRLGEIGGLGPQSIREIGLILVSHGLVVTGDGEAITAGCPVDCLGSVISGRVLNRLARADGRGVEVAPGGPPATVGDVVRLYRAGGLGQIAGLGTRSITEIEAGLAFAGLLLGGAAPVPQPRRAAATAPVVTADRAGTWQPVVPGSRRRQPSTGSGRNLDGIWGAPGE